MLTKERKRKKNEKETLQNFFKKYSIKSS